MNDESDFVKGLQLLLTSRLDECEAHFDKGTTDGSNPPRRVRSTFGRALVSVVRALISFEEDDKAAAMTQLSATQKLAQSSLLSAPSLSGSWFFSGGTKNGLSKEDRENVLTNLDLELLSADAGLFLAMIQFTQESAMGIMRGALTLRKSFKTYQKATRELRELANSITSGSPNSHAPSSSSRNRRSSSNDFSMSLSNERKRRDALAKASGTTQLVLIDNEMYFDAIGDDIWAELSRADEDAGYGPLVMKGTTVEDRVRASSKMGIGLFHLVFSLIPPRFASMIGSAMGFDTVPDKKKGLNCLRLCVDQGTSRSPLAALVLLAFHSAMLILARGVSDDSDVKEASEVLEQCLRQYPDSPLFRFFEGRLQRGRGRLVQASDAFELAQKCTRNIQQLAYLCIYERAWCAGLMTNKAKEAGSLFLTVARNSQWAPAFYGYLGASFYYDEAFRMLALMPDDIKSFSAALHGRTVDDDARELLEKALSWFNAVIQMNNKKKLFFPPEKFAHHRSMEIMAAASKIVPTITTSVQEISLTGHDSATLVRLASILFWPSLELAYMWNAFFQMENKGERRKQLEQSVKLLRKSSPLTDLKRHDHELMYRLFRGAFLREERKFFDADTELGHIVTSPDGSASSQMSEKWVIEFAKYERGLCQWELGDKRQATAWWEGVRDSGHHLDARLKFRVKSALRKTES